MIFKTLNGDLTVFNKTLISTKDHLKSLQTINATVYNKNGAFNLQGLLVNSSQSVSTFTKLNNAFKAYNGNLSKSTQLQNAYVQAVGKQNVTLGNYLAGLNGAKASMGGYVKSLVAAKAASIGLQAASIALNTAISMGITLAISALISAITKWVNKEKEAREEAIENAKAAKEEANNLSELLNKYNQLSKEVKSNQGVKEDLLSVQSDLLEALGIEASQIDTLIEKYGDLNSAINQITLDSLRDAQGDLMVAIDAYEKDLIKVGKGYAHWYSLFDRNLLSTGQSSTDALDILEKAGIISSGSHGEGGGALVLTGNDKTVEGILENYQKLKDAQEALNTAIDNGEITMEEMIKIPLYNDINSRLEELEESIGNYNTAIADLNKNIAQQQILKSLAEQSSIPETKEEFDAFQQSMIDTAIASTKFKGSQDDIRDSIINVLSVMPEFKKYFEELNDVQSSTSNNKYPISFADRFKNLWDSESFSSAKADLIKLQKEAGITEKDIQSLASENSELASLLNESGMSAQFAATCFNKMSNGADGFSSITEDALALDKVLHGMDESLQNVAASKSTYDKALEQDDYDSEFKNYQEAYKNAMQMFEDGDYGRHFRSSMEYFLGEDSYTMSIEELYSAMNNLKSVFGENATNGLEFVDKLYAKKDILDGMDSSLEKLSDGTYNVDLDPDEFEKIGEALGMTAEEVAACTNALGMFGNFHFYDLEEVEKTLNGISIAAKNGEQSILSMQGVEKILADIGYNGYDVYHIMQNIARMGSIQLLDFGAEDTESIQAVINKLKELDMIEISGNSINVSGLIDSLHESLGMAADDINAFLENINGQFKFADAEGSLISLDQAKNMALQAEDASAADGIDKIGEAAETTDGKVNTLHTDMEALNTLNLGGLMTQFNSAGTAVDNLNSKVQNLAAQMDAVNNKSVSASGVSTGAVPATNASAAKPNTGKVKALGNAQIGHLFSKGTIGAPKTETALINELGNETIIDPEKGTYEVVGGGAQFRKIKKGQIILNHLQTKALQKFGKISSFGKMLFGGNANMKGSSYVGGIIGGTNPATGKLYQKSSNSNTVKKATEEAAKETAEQAKEVSEEVFDWIEKRIEYFKRKFDKWIKQAETAVTSGFITKYYKKATNVIKKELNAYGKAYNRYMKEANAVGLDKKYRDKVKNGTIDIETIQDEALADKIQKYQEWYNKATESTESFVETAEKLYNLPLDKAATKIEKFKDAIDLLDKKLDNAIGSKAKNNLVDKQTNQEKKTIDANKKAEKEAQKNLKAAGKNLTKSSILNSSDVSANEKKKIKQAVKNGKEVNLSYFKEGSKAYNAAVKYNEALKANTQATYDLATAQEEYNAWLVEASKIKFDNIADDYNKQVQLLGFQMDALDNRISEIETKGEKVNKSYYESQKAINTQQLAQYKEEKAALEESLKNIKQGTDEWYDALEETNNVSSAISDCVKETYNLNNAINQLHFDLFEDISDSIGRIITEQEFLQGLFAHEKNADDETGNLTEAGIAKLGSLSASYYASKNRAEKDKVEVQELQRMFDSKSLHSDLLGITFNSLDDLEEKLKETYDKWQDDIKETYSLESSIADLMKEKYQAELNMLQDLIDAKKDALQAEKDLHDYQKSIQEKTKDINTIQSQIAAYSGDTSQEAMAKLQKLQKELSDKQDDLRETEYDKYISDQEDMLDKLYDEYSKKVEEKLEDFMMLVQEGLETANNNMASIQDFLGRIADENGYLSEIKGLFDSLGNIQDNVDKTVSGITTEETKGSGTETQMPTGLQHMVQMGGSNVAEELGNPSGNRNVGISEEVTTARNYIAKHASKTKKKKSECSDVNQKIYENKADSYSGKGRILSSDGMKGLAKKLGIKHDNASKDGSLYQKLKSIKFPGFKKGGVVPVEDIEKQVHDNGDTSLVSVQSGEAILTPVQTDLFQKFMEKMPEMTQAIDMSSLVKVPNYVQELQALHPVEKSMNHVVKIDNINLPNVTNAKEFSKELLRIYQKDMDFERLVKSMTTDRLAGGGRLGKHRIVI